MADRLLRKSISEIDYRRKKTKCYSSYDIELIKYITEETEKNNLDNISRTKAYERYFTHNQEIPWSFLASMVSRNAGWNMADLEGVWFPQSLTREYRELLFLTYERANWLIFSDAYPQLLLYEYSKKNGKSYFHLASAFNISRFIEAEWELFLTYLDVKRLMTSQIINEQNVIQLPVIEHPFYKKNVFRSMVFKLQDWFHFSAVLFPVCSGRIYGYSVHEFRNLSNRIELGTKLSQLLFDQRYFPLFYQFSKNTEHTGSRIDYEKYLNPTKRRDTPFLRTTFPIINHHKREMKDWYSFSSVKSKWYNHSLDFGKSQIDLTEWYQQKQQQLHLGITFEHLIKAKIEKELPKM
ncbi:DUF2515 family protein [Litchfieldia salsa]|uniref:DUF2515 domain-containing protein n=1 Tax=Litchfieldia salsa TaxID=930152 RepID=A0A1H0TJR3_9BACI|nr:DUF2515 family protein [Litchfieldia salsa]SDP54234.1 Protein of unknown function [Litchfieldia salsa]